MNLHNCRSVWKPGVEGEPHKCEDHSLGLSSAAWVQYRKRAHWQVFEEERDSIILLCHFFHFSESYKKMLPLLFLRCGMTQQNLKLYYLQHCLKM